MKEIYCEKFNRASFNQTGVATISQWSEQSSSVLTIDPDELLGHPYGILIKHHGELGLLGYVAIKELTHSGQVGQLGSLIISPLSIGNKVATIGVGYLLEHALQELPGMKAGFAYGNEKSTPLFEKFGGVVIGDREPSADTGCNSVVDLTDAMNLPGIDGVSMGEVVGLK
jgi:hypothetical protein